MWDPLALGPALAVCATIVWVLALASCGAKQPAAAKCVVDAQCGSYLCMNGTCLPRGMDRTVAVEILPRTDSTSARTGIPDVAFGPGQIALAADDRVIIEGTVTNAPNAHVVVLVANPIPGQPDLQFETDLAKFKFQIGVGRRLMHSMATIWLIPNVGSQLQPPVPFMTMLDSTLSFAFPADAEMTVVRGVLHDSLDGPASAFQVRAFVDNNVVSNVASTDDSGMFQVLIAPGAVPAADPNTMVTIDFTPASADSGPRFRTLPFPLAAAAANTAKVRTFRMPASLTPAPLRFVVQSADPAPARVADVTMRFRTEIPADDGVAIYEREARTNRVGEVEALLIPGTAANPRTYQIAILPPPDSPYGARCIPDDVVANVGNDTQPQYSATFSLQPKVILKGTILSSGSSPAATVSVMATQVPSDSECRDISAGASSPVSSTTLRNGTYAMLVDPGTYRLDIDPPMGSDVPRLTEEADDAVMVSTDPITTHDVILPGGEVIEGDVKDMDAMPLGSASVKIFQVLCRAESCGGPARVPPALWAQTRTDMLGHFRAVLPAP